MARKIDWPVCKFCQVIEEHPENIRARPDLCCQFCGMCGRPLTEKGWEMFVKKAAEYMTEEENPPLTLAELRKMDGDAV